MATKSKSKALEVYEGEFAITQEDDGLDSVADVLAENMPDGGMDFASLPRWTYPSQGKTTWEIDDPLSKSKKRTTQTIEGVVLHQWRSRAFYREAFGQGSEFPDCASSDALWGVKSNDSTGSVSLLDGTVVSFGGSCQSCPLNEWGTDLNPNGSGKGKACREYRNLVILETGEMWPTIVRLPSTQFGEWEDFVASLVRARMRLSKVVISITAVENKGWTNVEVELLGLLPEPAREVVVQLQSGAQSTQQQLLSAPAEGGSDEPPPPDEFGSSGPEVEDEDLPF